MKKFSSRKATSSKNTKFIWDPKSTTMMEYIYTNKELNFKSILRFINDPKQPFFIKQEVNKIDE